MLLFSSGHSLRKLGLRQTRYGSVLRVLRDEEWLSQRDLHFREFMKLLNRLGAGKVFETYTEAEIDLFVLKCVDSAKEQVQLLKK
ncbi:DUF6339 family protein [Acinetobacter faecalis]|uniref:DUF6339 family protein n=1 Tax=Acinetobacter faecalis TaxID=2665161 RepID=UPI002A9117B9|nr:DUF6339 family protein [Acinetobacter faecalis]MDY6536548.1 DUF6339 family protein [Acinetobacter faecalis]